MINYQKRTVIPMRPYIPGEDMSDVVIGEHDVPELGGMIGTNGNKNFYIPEVTFLKEFELNIED
jgi:hypothetical protein